MVKMIVVIIQTKEDAANRYVIQLKNSRAIMASVSPQALSVMGLMIAEMAVTKLLTADLDVHLSRKLVAPATSLAQMGIVSTPD